MPETMGKDEEKKFEVGDNFSGRIQTRYDTQVTNQPNERVGPAAMAGKPSALPDDLERDRRERAEPLWRIGTRNSGGRLPESRHPAATA